MSSMNVFTRTRESPVCQILLTVQNKHRWAQKIGNLLDFCTNKPEQYLQT